MANVIDSLSFDNVKYSLTLPYGSCSTDAATAAKTVTVNNFDLDTGSRIAVKFTVTNTASSPTLNVNNTGAKAIYYRGSAISAGYLASGRTYEFVYNGTQWEVVGDIDTNSDKKAASGNSSSKLFLIGATSQSSSGQTTYSHDTAYVGTDGCLYSNSTKVSVEGHTHDYAASGHTHNYAGSSSAGGSATSAVKLDSNAGSATQPVYFSGGKPVACTYYVNKTVPADAVFTDTTYSAFVKSGSGAKAGLVPAPSTTAGTTKYLREDGTWQVPPDTNTTYSNMTAATSSAAGKAGLVPAPAAGKQSSFLRGDGSWATPTNTTYSAASGGGLSLSSTAFSVNTTFTSSGKNYAVKVDSTSGGLYVNVPWTDTDTKYTLPSASPSTLGGVKIGSNISVSSGTISLTKSNVTTALGYTPPTTNTTYDVVTRTTAGLMAGHYYAYLMDHTHSYAASNHTHDVSIAADSGTNQLTLAHGTKYKLTAGGKSFIFTMPSDNNTTYGVVSTSANGLAPKLPGGTTQYLRADGTWATPPDTNTTYSAASQSAAGLMSAADKKKLDGIASGATANTGDITGVTAGNGLTGGATSGSATLNVGAGSGIVVNADDVAVNTSFTTSGKNYKVAVDATSGGLYVNVPWTDTDTKYTLPAATPSALGGVKTSTGITNSSGTISVSYGTTAGTACQGNDSRLSDSRTPKAHNQASNTITAMTSYSKPSSTSAIAATDSLNTAIGKLEKALDGKGTSNLAIGTTATTAAAGNHTHSQYLTSHQSLANYSTLANTIKSLSISGKTITYTKGDGSTGTLTTQDTNTTYDVATRTANGLMASHYYAHLMDHGHSSYLPKSGGNVTGHIYLTGAVANSSTSNTSQIIFGTSGDNHVAISSNNNALIINPSAGATTNQIVLYLDQASSFPSGISGNLYGNASSASALTTSSKGSATNPVYFSGGVPVACTYSLGASVPSNAKFTDTTYSSGTGITISGTTINLNTGYYATTTQNGLMSASDKSKLDGIAAGATAITIGTGATNAAAGNHTHSNYLSSSPSSFTITGAAASSSSIKTLFTIKASTVNKFRVQDNGGVYGKQYYTSGADYAEYMEWQDQNLDKEDRRGYFVTLVDDCETIKIANSNDDVIGVVSSTPSVIGNDATFHWSKMYMTDVYGETLFEEVKYPETTDEEGNVIPAHTEMEPKLNPEYDPTREYIPRNQRPEWAAIGMLGQLVVRDDGTCKAGKYCKCNDEGIATIAEGRNGWRVLKRLDEHHIRILFR